MATIIRQGDVMLFPIQSVPHQAKRVSDQKVVVHGERTGHSHQLTADAKWVDDADDNTEVVQIEESAQIVHEEHENIDVPAGIYKVKIQREHNSGEGRISRRFD
jgi:hypothetical protein